MAEQIRVLHIDDEPDFTETTASFLEYEDSRFDVETATSIDDGLALLSDSEFDCIVSDYDMGEVTGIELLQEVRREYPDIPFILFTGKGSEEVASQAFSAGATDYLQKGGGTDQYELLANRIRNTVEQYQSRRAQQWLVELVENTDRVVYSFAADFDEVLFMSSSYEEVWGRSVSELQSEPEDFLKGIHPDDRREVQDAMDSVSEEQQVNIEFRVNANEEYRRWIRAHMEPIATETGTVTRIGGFAADITETRRRQERHQQQRETLLRLATDKAVTSGDLQTAVQRVTEAAASVLEVPRVNVWMAEDEGGEEILRCIDHYDSRTDNHQQGLELVKEDYPAYLRALETHQAIDADDALKDPRTAELRDYLNDNNIRALLDGTLRSEGEVIGVVCHEHVGATREWTDDEIDFASDIADIVHRALQNHELKQRETKLEQYHNYTDRVFDAIDDLFFVLDEDGNLIQWNDSLTEVTGYTDEEIESMNGVEFVTESDQDETIEAICRVFETGHAQLETSLVTKDGTKIPYEFVADRVTHPDGTKRLVGIGRNISSRIERERKLERIREQMAFGLDITDSILWALDFETGKSTNYGPTERVFGENPEGMDDFITNIVHPDDRTKVSKVFKDVRDGKSEEFNVEFRTIPSHEETKWVQSTAYVRSAETEERAELVGLATDVTERRERERELKRQNDRLEEFTSVVSHDLRSPLGVAEGRLRLAQADCNSEHLDDVAQALDRIDTLINDLLTLAREGEDVGQIDTVNLGDIARTCWGMVETPGASLEVDISCEIYADRTRLRQLIENCYRNAIEHAGEEVTITVDRLDSGFYIADDGPGISDANKQEVFKAGYSTNETGSGFGLSIIRQIAEAHGWEVRVVDSSEGGARFEITGVEFVDTLFRRRLLIQLSRRERG
mgnify:CR=1 FL=1